jgi:hypothetical protein
MYSYDAKDLMWLFFFFGDTGVWIQGFIFARQALYSSGHASSPFCSGYFGVGISLFFCPCKPEQTDSCFMPLAVSGMTAASYHTQLFSIEMESCKLFCLGWPGTAIFPTSASCVAWDGRYLPLRSANGWDWNLVNFLSFSKDLF